MSIIGLGLIGGSIAQVAGRVLRDCKITGYDVEEATRNAAVRRGCVHRTTATIEACAADADLIVIATPLGAAPGIFSRLAPVMPVNAVMTDVCSTKRSICKWASKLLPAGGRCFVGAHPMFGSEHSGIEHADAKLLKGCRCILTPTARADPAAVRRIEAFWRSLELSTVTLSPARHDRLLARASHLPQVLASVLMARQDKASMLVSGRGLRDTTRLAGSSPELWAEILTDNADHVASELRGASERLTKLAAALEKGDRRKAAAMIAAGRKARQALLEPSEPPSRRG